MGLDVYLDKVLGVILLHKHLDLLPQACHQPIRRRRRTVPLVPGFWPSKGVVWQMTVVVIVRGDAS
jgi:hypothetical protein